MRSFLLFVLGLLVGILVTYTFMKSDTRNEETETAAATESQTDHENNSSTKADRLGNQPANQTIEHAATSTKPMKGMTLYEQAEETLKERSFEVKKVLDDGFAFAKGKKGAAYIGLEAVLYNREAKAYYNGQIVDAPNGKCFKVVGLYKYVEYGEKKTAPIVMIMNK